MRDLHITYNLYDFEDARQGESIALVDGDRCRWGGRGLMGGSGVRGRGMLIRECRVWVVCHCTRL